MTGHVLSTHPVLDSLPRGLFIGGEWREGSGDSFAVNDPATLVTLAKVGNATEDDGRAALDAAVGAQQQWAAASPQFRADILRAAYDAVRLQRDDFAHLMTLEMGKPLAEAQAELDYAAAFLRWFSEEAIRVDGGYMLAPDGQSRLLVTSKAVGPCLLITPWNFPLAMATRKVAPALAAGCTVVLKPSELTPLTTLLFTKLLAECGLPPGVVNVVTTLDAGGVTGPLLEDGRIRKLSFTGSTAVGKRLLAQCAPKVVRTSLELGGNAAFVVFSDADLDKAVDGAVIAKTRNMGEACTAANRFFVHREVVDEFADRLAGRLAAMPLGHGLQRDTQIGPLINDEARTKITGLVDDAVGRGAVVVEGDSPLPDLPGWFLRPAVLKNISSDAQLTGQEIFGPVAPIMAFDTEDEAVSRANDTNYGLAAYVYSENLERGLRVADALDVGMVGLNRGIVSNAAAPFGGVKESGTGREGGTAGIREYLDTKYIAVPR